MFNLKSKGVSEIINVILLIVIIVILSGLFFAWLKNSANTRMDEVSAELKEASALECSNADFRIESVTFDDYTKNLEILFNNNSNLKIFNLVLTIEWENNSGEQVSIAGAFQDIIPKGETKNLYTGTNFTFTRGSQSILNDLNIDSISNIALTNGTCPKEITIINTYDIEYTASAPTANPAGGTYTSAQSIALSTVIPDSNIYYTIDGNTPTSDSNLYTSAINLSLDTETTIKAIVVAESYDKSSVFTGDYIITHTLTTPTADPVAGSYYSAQNITLSAEDGSTIYYTTNGDTPTISSSVYSTAIPITIGTTTLKAISVKENYANSSVFSGTYTVTYPQNGEIWYLEHLDYIDTNSTTLAGAYTLMRDLNFLDDNSYYNPTANKSAWTDGNGWEPIGTYSTAAFSGDFDGNNFTISNLYIDRLTTDYVGFFEYTNTNSDITNLKIEDINIIGGSYVGGLVGFNYGLIYNCHVTGSVYGSSSYVGGLVAKNHTSDTKYVSYSSFNGNVSGAAGTGGLMAWNFRKIEYCYSSGTVVGSSSQVGGLLGYSYDSSTISNCYSTSSVTGTYTVGGLIGFNFGNVNNCYSTGAVSGIGTLGGLIADQRTPGAITNSYWDMNTSGRTTSSGDAIGKTTTEMKTQSTFTDWNFSGIWEIAENVTYPFLASNAYSGAMAGTPVADPVEGTYSSTQSVTLSSPTIGASIYYTTNGDTPTTSSTLYTGAISISSTTTLKAIAVKEGRTDSNIFIGVYTIGAIQYNTGALSPGTVVDDATIGTTSWIYPNNSKISDDSYASAEVGVTLVYTAYKTHYLKATNFDFNIPTGATIDGIKVEVEEYASGPLNYSSANIVKANGVVGSTIIYDNNSPSSETNIIFGGDNQLWGETWTAENINDSNFGVAISVRGFSMYCLEENSLISTNQGYKKIKNINIGDLVYSYNETDNKLELKPVTGVWSNPISKINSRYFYIYYNNGEVIKATENHRFYVSGEYKRADELLIGDLLLSQDFQNYAIENIEIIENTTDKVWDIEVEDNHNFFVNDILVHNPSSPLSPLDPTPYYIYVDHIRATVYYTN